MPPVFLRKLWCVTQSSLRASIKSRVLRSILVATVFVSVLIFLQVTRAQVLKGDYQFQGARTSSTGTSALTDTGVGSNTFQTETVDGVSRTVLRFVNNNGLRLSSATSVIPNNSWTIVMLFKLDNVNGFVRLVDFKNRTTDDGLYVLNGQLENCQTCTSIPANTYVQVVYTRNSSGTFAAYVNGVLQLQGPDVDNDAVIDGSNLLNFFQDDLAVPNEASAGSVARIRLYDAPMTAAEVAALDRLPLLPVTNTNDSGAGSLRQAITTANAQQGLQTITFNIPGAGVRTISPTSALPAITDPVAIDGSTQPGFAGTPIIELNGTTAGGGSAGLNITAANSTVRGLVINRFNGAGISISTGGFNTIRGNYIGTDASGNSAQGNNSGVVISTSTNNTIGGNTAADRNVISGNVNNGFLCNGNNANNNVVQGNYIGTNAAGTAPVPNNFSGVNIIGPATGNLIGGTSAGRGNVISGNVGRGVLIQNATATTNVVQGNLIGLAADGVTPLGNTGAAGFGVRINSAANNIIGGTVAGTPNAISGNDQSGISILGATATGNLVQGNFIGTDLNNTVVAGNRAEGISIRTGANNNTIGGVSASAGNRIVNNVLSGVLISDAGTIRNAVLSNQIYSNDRLGINLQVGGNNNFELAVTSAGATSNGVTTTVQTTFTAAASTTYNIQAFSNVTCDPSGFGEGQALLGSTNVSTSGSGAGNMNQVFPSASVPTGQFVTITATDPLNNTSRFTRCLQVNPSVLITGIIKNTSNVPISNVTVTLSGAQSASTKTDANGNYSFNVTAGSYTITPSKINVTFLPTSSTVSSNSTVDFTGTVSTGPGGKIVFDSVRDGNNEIYSMNSDGSNQTRLTNDAGTDNDPTWSPNGSKIAFESNRTGNLEIFSMNADGSVQTNLTNNAADEDSASWSPDGTKIAFVSDRDGNLEIYVMNANGSGQTRLTNVAGIDEAPAWSPDGTKLAFESERDGNREIYVMNANGTNQLRLTNNSAYDSAAAWSPDGTKLVFGSSRDGNFEIYSMDANGSNQVRLTNNIGNDTFPSYSPDGTQITFGGTRDPQGDSEIFVMNANGSNETNISNVPFFFDGQPTWQTQAALPPVFDVTGQLTDVSGNGLAGISVALTGPGGSTTTTDANGNYSFLNLQAGGNYVVTPSSSDFSFSPINRTFNALQADQIAKFVGTQSVVGINGTVTDSNNLPLNNVTVTLTKNGIAAGSVQTDVLGNYGFANQTSGANYAVTAIGSFVPASRTMNNLTVNATVNFKSVPTIPPQCSTPNFAPPVSFAVGSAPSGIEVSDLNGDGRLDLVASDLLDNNVAVLIATGPNTFAPVTHFAAGGGPRSVSAGDLNGDGKLDLVVANSSSNNISVLLGNGVGGFGSATNLAVGTNPGSSAIADFNQDGNADLAISNTDSNNISVLLGLGGGSFGAPTNQAVGTRPFSIVAADLNGDGRLDMVVGNLSSANVSVLLGNGTGGFGPATNFAVGNGPQSVKVADFNRDGKFDLAVANFNSNTVSLLLGNGAGSFALSSNFAVGASPASAVVGDFNQDGNLDVVTANSFGGVNSVSVLFGNSAGSFASAVNFPTGSQPFSVGAGDFNGDGRLDLAAGLSFSNITTILNIGATCGSLNSLSVSGEVRAANNTPLADVAVTLSGPITRVVTSDLNGNYSFPNLVPGGNYAVTVQSSQFVFAPSRADLFNLSSNQTVNFNAAPNVVPLPTPTPSDNFNSPTRDPERWNLGTQTQPVGAVDPLVTTTQVNGQLVITPRAQQVGLHYNGYVSANSFDFRNGAAGVELIQAASGGADSMFAIGSDRENFTRFVVHTAGGPSAVVNTLRDADGTDQPVNNTIPQLIFQVMIGGQPAQAVSIPYDPVQHRHLRFRHEATANAILFETSPNNIDFVERHRVSLQKSVSALTAELSAGTPSPTNPGQTIFDNFSLVTSTYQFSAANYAVGEGEGSIVITVTRQGSPGVSGTTATVSYQTTDGTAQQKSRYIPAVGTLTFAPGQMSRTFTVLVVDNVLTEGNQTVNLLLGNPLGSGLNTPGRAVLTIIDNDTLQSPLNPLDEATFYAQQHYLDFLNRQPDPSGVAFWANEITSCGADVQCREVKRINVSAAFFLSIEFQETGYLVERIYKVAYGDGSGTSTLGGTHQLIVPIIRREEFLPDTQEIGLGLVVGPAGWEQKLDQNKAAFANGFVQRARFQAAYANTLTPAQYIDLLFQHAGVTPTATERNAVLAEFAGAQTSADVGARGRALRKVAEHSTLATQESNRAFVLMQYFGYLRRNPNDPQDTDYTGYDFWLTKLNQFNGNAVNAEMVKAFILAGEYRQRFGP